MLKKCYSGILRFAGGFSCKVHMCMLHDNFEFRREILLQSAHAEKINSFAGGFSCKVRMRVLKNKSYDRIGILLESVNAG